MLPVFKEYYDMLIEHGATQLKQYSPDKLWVDMSIVKGISKHTYEPVKILRIKIDDDLNMAFSDYKTTPQDSELETFEDSYQRLCGSIKDKEDESKLMTEKIINKYKNHKLILTTSMGKDSILTEYLLEKWGYVFDEKIFNNTTMDTADNYKMVKSAGDIKIVTPQNKEGQNESFYRLTEHWGMPSRHARWCCTTFKEGATYQYLEKQDNILFVMGMRNEESSTRSGYGFEYKNIGWKNDTWVALLPIVRWTEFELWLYTIHNKIPINPKYKKGYSRCGCHIACPFYSKSTWVLDKTWYKNQYDRFHRMLEEDFIKNEKWTRLNCTLSEYHYCWNGGVYREQATPEVIQEFANHKGIEYDVAEKFFSKTCDHCNNTKGKPRPITKKDEVSMNLKLLGRNTEKYLCKKCLMKYMDISEEQWQEYIKRFKSQGCDLF